MYSETRKIFDDTLLPLNGSHKFSGDGTNLESVLIDAFHLFLQSQMAYIVIHMRIYRNYSIRSFIFFFRFDWKLGFV